MSAPVAIQWLSEAIASGEVITSADRASALTVADACDPEDAAVIFALLNVFMWEHSDKCPPMPEPRTPTEQRALDASMRVAMAPDPNPRRSRPVRAALSAAWDEREGGPRADRVATARVMRSASPEDRSFLMTLRGMR